MNSSKRPQTPGGWGDAKYRKLLLLILGVTLVRGLMYVSVIPPWQAPDEEFHYIQSRTLMSNWDAAPSDEWQEELIASLLKFRVDELNKVIRSPEHAVELAEQRFENPARKSLSYWLFAAAALPLSGASVVAQLYAMRLVSVIVTLATVALGWATLRELFPQDHFAPLVGICLLVFLPQHTHIGAAVSDGNLTELLVTAALYVLVVLTLKGVNFRRIVFLLALVTVALTAKRTALPLIFVTAVALSDMVFLQRGLQLKSSLLLLTILLSLGVMGVWLSPYRSVLLRGPAYLEQGFVETLSAHPDSPGYLWTFQMTYQSFWAALGWLMVRLAEAWYWLLLGMVIAAILGLARFSLGRKQGDTSRHTRRAIAVLGLAFSAWVLLLLLWFMANPTGEIYAQGRYLYPAIVPFVALFGLGWREIIPVSWRRYTILPFFIAVVLFDAMTLWNYAVPFFYPLWRI